LAIRYPESSCRILGVSWNNNWFPHTHDAVQDVIVTLDNDLFVDPVFYHCTTEAELLKINEAQVKGTLSKPSNRRQVTRTSTPDFEGGVVYVLIDGVWVSVKLKTRLYYCLHNVDSHIGENLQLFIEASKNTALLGAFPVLQDVRKTDAYLKGVHGDLDLLPRWYQEYLDDRTKSGILTLSLLKKKKGQKNEERVSREYPVESPQARRMGLVSFLKSRGTEARLRGVFGKKCRDTIVVDTMVKNLLRFLISRKDILMEGKDIPSVISMCCPPCKNGDPPFLMLMRQLTESE